MRRAVLTTLLITLVSGVVYTFTRSTSPLCDKVRAAILNSAELRIYLPLDDQSPVGIVINKQEIESIASAISCHDCRYLDQGVSLALRGTTFLIKCDSRAEVNLATNFVVLMSDGTDGQSQKPLLCKCSDSTAFALCEKFCGRTFQELLDDLLQKNAASAEGSDDGR